MKKITILVSGLLLLLSSACAEIIKIYSPYSPAHSGTPALKRIVDQANSMQNAYTFVVEFKPGGNQIIAVKSLDEHSLAIVAPAFVENVDSNKLVESEYAPVFALGNACWAVITNKPFVGAEEFVVGGVGFGNAAHLTALSLAEKYKFNVRYIVFKSNNDALINMAGNHGVELVIDRFDSFRNLQTKNNKLTMQAASCPTRLPQAPDVKTLKELGFDAPYIFNIIIARNEMPVEKRTAIEQILNSATIEIGKDELYKLSAMQPPVFDNVSTQDFYSTSIGTVRNLLKKYQAQIEHSKNN
jgi:hypothetical protein